MANALDFLIRDYSELTSILVTEGKKQRCIVLVMSEAPKTDRPPF